MSGTLREGIRLAVGTLTRLPVPPPERIDQRVAGVAMTLAPLVGLGLALMVGVPMAALAWAMAGSSSAATGILLAALAVGCLAWLTRGLHLDGLADLADALGSGKPADQALAIARRSDIGPFGTMALVLALLLQSAALALALAHGAGLAALAVAVVSARLGLTWACTPRWRPARPDGLGATVAQSTTALGASLLSVALLCLAGALGWLLIGNALGGLALVAGVIAALLAAHLVCRTAERRLGGVTGDVLGAAVEWSTTASLVASAILESLAAQP